ncbi:hypothetical protein FACS1894147_05380 [Spirochaetia bacterium]|nr:hypothetical protein FACS1894147_05380 [Spirochaetia bacterium]
MKKNVFLMVMLGMAGTWLLTGCATPQPLIWDESLNDEECATVYFSGFNITAYNDVSLGKTVDKNPESYDYGNVQYTLAMKIPAGETTFTGVGLALVNIRGTRIRYVIPDMTVAWNYEAGKIYCLRFGNMILAEYEDQPVWDTEQDKHQVQFRIYDGFASTGSPPSLWKAMPLKTRESMPRMIPVGDGTYTTKPDKSFWKTKSSDYLLATIPVDIDLTEK